MDNKRLKELAGVQLNENMVDVVAAHKATDDIIEGLAIHCLENNLKLSDVIHKLKAAYERSANGRDENEK